MTIRKIITFPAQSLRDPCALLWPPFPPSHEILEHIGDLKDTLAVTPHGLALASNQILPSGHRVFVVKDGYGLPTVAFNPMWRPAVDRTMVREDEGCLSIPGLFPKIERFVALEFTYQDADGTSHTMEVHGRAARIVQHECEHLAGGMILDWVDDKTRIKAKVEAIRNRKKGR